MTLMMLRISTTQWSVSVNLFVLTFGLPSYINSKVFKSLRTPRIVKIVLARLNTNQTIRFVKNTGNAIFTLHSRYLVHSAYEGTVKIKMHQSVIIIPEYRIIPL